MWALWCWFLPSSGFGSGCCRPSFRDPVFSRDLLMGTQIMCACGPVSTAKHQRSGVSTAHSCWSSTVPLQSLQHLYRRGQAGLHMILETVPHMHTASWASSHSTPTQRGSPLVLHRCWWQPYSTEGNKRAMVGRLIWCWERLVVIPGLSYHRLPRSG